jgi:hypothetical protein
VVGEDVTLEVGELVAVLVAEVVGVVRHSLNVPVPTLNSVMTALSACTEALHAASVSSCKYPAMSHEIVDA